MKRIRQLFLSPPLLFAVIAVAAYGLLIPRLGFYWDDLPIGWIRYGLGQNALTQYFSTNRPVWGIWYGFLSRFIPYQPLYWQLLALFWRWLSGLLFWAVLRALFPQQTRVALAGGLLFMLYPGFNQQSVSFVYGYHFTVYCLYLFSLLVMLWTARRPQQTKIFLPLGLLASALNLVMGEYFFMLDLLRPVLLWIVLTDGADRKATLRRVLRNWFPYLTVFLAGVIWRSFFFSNITYEYNLLADLRARPLPALLQLAATVAQSLWITLVAAWGQAFRPPDFFLQGKLTIGLYIAVVLSTLGLVLFALYSRKKNSRPPIAFALLGAGGGGALLAGIPFWVTGLSVNLSFPASRATLPFMLGGTLVLLGLLLLIRRPRLRMGLFALLIAFAAGRQFLWADEFRRDWTVLRNFYWQLSWRVPALEEDTLLLLNEGALKFYADNSLAAPVNWIYAPDAEPPHIPYMLFYPSNRLGNGLPAIRANTPVSHDFLVGQFNGSTAQMLVMVSAPPGCLRIVDPEVDIANRLIADKLIREAVPLSDTSRILTSGLPRLPDIYAPEPDHGWCYYFERADLSRQQGDWAQVAALGDQALALDDHPNDPNELFVFIEGYAHSGDWAQAEQLSLRANRVSPAYIGPPLCRLWSRIGRSTADSPEKTATISKLDQKLACDQE